MFPLLLARRFNADQAMQSCGLWPEATLKGRTQGQVYDFSANELSFLHRNGLYGVHTNDFKQAKHNRRNYFNFDVEET
jgi:hypothetical protein